MFATKGKDVIKLVTLAPEVAQTHQIAVDGYLKLMVNETHS